MTGIAVDTVFADVPMVRVCHFSWRYVLIEAGAEQVVGWRERDRKLAIPEIIFPADRSWLLSTMWDDDWSCIGGSDRLVSGLLAHPLLGARSRQVSAEQDAAPPGHEAH